MIDLTVEMDAEDAKAIDKLLFTLSTGLAGHAITTGPQRDLRTMLGVKVLPYLQDRMRQRFRSAGDDASGRWAPLSPRTHWWREQFIANTGASIKKDRPINVRTGELREFATTTFDMESTATTATLTLPTRAVRSGPLATKLRHAQLGGQSPSGTAFPARPVARINARDREVIERHTINWINDILEDLT